MFFGIGSFGDVAVYVGDFLVGFNPKISIIILVYNTEKYLNKCLNSIENQTLKRIEIICVNDGSKDDSLNILRKHGKKCRRIHVISQKNSGMSIA